MYRCNPLNINVYRPKPQECHADVDMVVTHFDSFNSIWIWISDRGTTLAVQELMQDYAKCLEKIFSAIWSTTYRPTDTLVCLYTEYIAEITAESVPERAAQLVCYVSFLLSLRLFT